MSFRPLPESLVTLLDGLAALPGSRVVDLGCGDGQLTRQLEREGLEVLPIDRLTPLLGTAARLVAEARSLPLREGSVDVLVAGNLVRHLLPGDPEARFLEGWARTLKPGGALFVLEDRPTARNRPQQNYLAFQEFLGELAEGRRGPLLEVQDFLDRQGCLLPGGQWSQGHRPNDWTVDISAVLHLLRGQGPTPQGEVAKLIKSLQLDGLQYSDYWWASWHKTAGKVDG